MHHHAQNAAALPQHWTSHPLQHTPFAWLRILQLRITPGRKGMQQLLHKIPTWLDFADTEKLEVKRVDWWGESGCVSRLQERLWHNTTLPCMTRHQCHPQPLCCSG